MRYLLLLVGLLATSSSFAQNFTLSGYIKDANTGEALIGAAVAVSGAPARGTVTNVYGYYVLSLPAGTYDFSELPGLHHAQTILDHARFSKTQY
jgi:hypothetical protein